jgi:hypothetical protein
MISIAHPRVARVDVVAPLALEVAEAADVEKTARHGARWRKRALAEKRADLC